MKLIKIIVDEIPNSCSDCDFICERYYCRLKGIAVGQQFVDRNSNKRDKDCPLQVRRSDVNVN